MYFIYRLIILNLIASNIYGEQVPLYQLYPGDTINLKNLNTKSTEVFGYIFNSMSDGNIFTFKENFTNSPRVTVHREICSSIDDLKTFLHPTVYEDGIKLHSSEIFGNLDTNIYQYLNNFKVFFDEYLYSFGFIKNCRIFNEQNLIVDLIDDSYLPIFNEHIVYKIKKFPFGILRLRKNQETHYVSSISTGHCLFQIFINEKDKYENYGRTLNSSKSDDFFRFPSFKSPIFTIYRNNDGTEQIFSIHDISVNYSLYDSLLSPINLLENPLEENHVVKLKLRSLPESLELPKIRERPNFEEAVKPGDIIDQHDFNKIALFHKDKQISFDTITTAPMTSFKLTNCYEYDDNNTKLLTKSETEFFRYQLNLFYRQVMEKNYEIDRKYLNDNYKCYQVTICSQFQGPKPSEMPSPIKVISLDKLLAANRGYNFMFNENVVMRLSDQDKLYYVTRAEYGDCLFQALIYPSSTTVYEVETYKKLPEFIGPIISASGNQTLHNSVRQLITNQKNSVGDNLLNAKHNVIDITLPIFSMLTDNVLINLHLEELH